MVFKWKYKFQLFFFRYPPPHLNPPKRYKYILIDERNELQQSIKYPYYLNPGICYCLTSFPIWIILLCFPCSMGTLENGEEREEGCD